MPDNLRGNKNLQDEISNIFQMDPFKVSDLLEIQEVWTKKETSCFEYMPSNKSHHDQDRTEKVKEILSQPAEIKSDFKHSQYLCLNIETYCQEGTDNGMKGVSRVVIVN